MKKSKNSVQGLIGLERFTRFGVKTDKAEIAFFSVEPKREKRKAGGRSKGQDVPEVHQNQTDRIISPQIMIKSRTLQNHSFTLALRFSG